MLGVCWWLPHGLSSEDMTCWHSQCPSVPHVLRATAVDVSYDMPLVGYFLATQSTDPALQAEARAMLGDSKGSAQAYESALAAKPAGDVELLQGLVSALVADGNPQQVCRLPLLGRSSGVLSWCKP